MAHCDCESLILVEEGWLSLLILQPTTYRGGSRGCESRSQKFMQTVIGSRFYNYNFILYFLLLIFHINLCSHYFPRSESANFYIKKSKNYRAMSNLRAGSTCPHHGLSLWIEPNPTFLKRTGSCGGQSSQADRLDNFNTCNYTTFPQLTGIEVMVSLASKY